MELLAECAVRISHFRCRPHAICQAKKMGRPPADVALPSCLRLIRRSYRGILAILATEEEPLGSPTREALAAMAAPMLRMLIQAGLEPRRRRGRPRKL